MNYRNEMISFWLEKVRTRFDSNFGTGNSLFKMLITLSPKYFPLEKPLKIKCGYASLMASGFSFRSCLKIAAFIPKNIVGPKGKWDTIIPSGSPLCSWNSTMSVKSFLFASYTSSLVTVCPLFMRIELGITRLISFMNWINLEEGCREVVINSLGSRKCQLLYSSSMLVRAINVFSSSNLSSF